MVTVFLRGGLGNQMFQYALGLNLARRNNIELRLDTVFLNDRFPRKQFTYRTYDLDVFDIEPKFTALSKISTTVPIPGVWLGADLALIEAGSILGARRVLKEKDDGIFDADVFRATGSNLLLYGFWQSPKYFAGVEKELKNIFTFRQPMQGEVARLAEEIKNTNAVSLHVRRADYLLAKYQSTYGNTNVRYYTDAIAHIASRVQQPKFFIFSDDIAWCREHIRPPFPTAYVDDASKGPKSTWHIQLMSLCKHNIVANSTFSWWSAWLNRNQGKIVIAPKQWHPGQDRNDIVPEEWVKI
jgi:hypothetical protein